MSRLECPLLGWLLLSGVRVPHVRCPLLPSSYPHSPLPRSPILSGVLLVDFSRCLFHFDWISGTCVTRRQRYIRRAQGCCDWSVRFLDDPGTLRTYYKSKRSRVLSSLYPRIVVTRSLTHAYTFVVLARISRGFVRRTMTTSHPLPYTLGFYALVPVDDSRDSIRIYGSSEVTFLIIIPTGQLRSLGHSLHPVP